MSRCQKDPLRPLTEDECQKLQRLAHSGSEPAEQVARAKALLAVVEGHSYLEAARSVGRKSSDAVSQLVARFNREGRSSAGAPAWARRQAEVYRGGSGTDFS
jgi:hypothetical protein